MSKSFLSPEDYIEKLDASLDAHRNAENAAAMTKYMKGLFNYYGIKSPERRAIWRDFKQQYGLPKDWKSAVSICWKYDEREMQYIGMELAFSQKKKWQKEDLEFFEFMIKEKSWWDSVDFIASNIIGHYFFIYPDQIKPVTDIWRHSNNMWLIRTCLIFQLKYRDYTDFKLMQGVIHENKYSKEFFIQKAIGWALRQYARHAPKDVRAFVAETELKPLSRREALKHFS